LALQIVNQAVQGDLRAIFKLIDLIDDFENRDTNARSLEYPLTDADLENLRTIVARLNASYPKEK
jgi:hypothetical protein